MAAGFGLTFVAGYLSGRGLATTPAPAAHAPGGPNTGPQPLREANAPDASPAESTGELARLQAENRALAERIAALELKATAVQAGPGPLKPGQTPDPASVPELLARLRDAVTADLPAEVNRLSTLLRGIIGSNPELAAQVLDLALAESDPRVAAALLGGIPKNDVLANPAVRARVLDLIRTGASAAHKTAALHLFQAAAQRDPSALDLITERDLAMAMRTLREEPDESLRTATTQLLARFAGRPDVADALLEMAGSVGTQNAEARAAAIESLRTIEGERTVGVLLRVLQEDTDPKLRRKAIESLGILAPQQRKADVVATLSSVIERETDPDQRNLMLLSMVRIAPEQTAPLIRRILPTVENAQQREHLDATASLIESGERDWLKLILKLQGRQRGR